MATPFIGPEAEKTPSSLVTKAPQVESVTVTDEAISSFTSDEMTFSFEHFDGTPEIEFTDFESLDDVFAQERKAPRSAANAIEQTIVLSFDTEYVRSEDGNSVLCYSYTIGMGDQYCSGIIYPKSTAKKDRIKLGKLIREAVELALSQGLLEQWPESITVAAHFLRTDLMALGDAFSDLKTKVQGIRKTVATLKGSYGLDIDEVLNGPAVDTSVNVYDTNRNYRQISIVFRDSMLLAPQGKKLADVGELVGIEKEEIPAGFSIERMDEYLEKDREGFERYAIRDAEICYLHIQRMVKFVTTELGMKRLPISIGGLAVKAFTDKLKADGVNELDVFGYEEQTREVWSKKTGKPRTIKQKVPVPARRIFEQFAAETYQGGRAECFLTGPTDIDQWNDLDAPSCFPVILTDCRPLDFDNVRMELDPQAYRGDVFGLARVRFKHPEDTRYPCLPVRAPGRVYFPLEGESYCTAKEIEVALNIGCEITVLQGFIIPWVKDSDSIFRGIMTYVRQKRLQFPKKSFEELMWKEISNSLYGKLAQGLSGKTAFDTEKGINKPIGPSRITHPFFASYVTGFSRALLAEMLNGIPMDKKAVSVTSDGFLTNASVEEIDLSGPVCSRFRELFHQIDPYGGEILECKHRVKQLIAMKTRGQLTVIPDEDPKYEPVIAKAGVQVPKGEDEHRYMVDLYLSRYPGQKVKANQLTSTRKQFMNDQDMVNEESEKRLNLELDFKRMPCHPRMLEASGVPHIALDSKPLKTVDEGEYHKLRMDQWRENNCLKTLDDWNSLQEYILLRKYTSECGIRLNPGEKAHDLFIRLFMRAYKQEALGLTRTLTYKALGAFLADNGFPAPTHRFGSWAGFPVTLGVIPLTMRVKELIDLLLTKFPNFEYQAMLAGEAK